MIFKRIKRASAIFQSWNNDYKILLQISNSKLDHQYIQKSMHSVKRKPYQALLFDRQKLLVKVQEQQVQLEIEQLMPKFVLDVTRNQMYQYSFLQKIFLSSFVEQHPAFYQAIAMSIVEDMIKNIKNDRVIDFQLKQLYPKYIDKIIRLFNTIESSINQNIVEILCFHLIEIVAIWLKEERKLQQDQKTQQDWQIKLKYKDIQKLIDYLIIKGFVPIQILDKYIEQLKIIPKIGKKDAPKTKLQIFKRLKQRIRVMHHLQETNFKVITKVEDKPKQNQAQKAQRHQMLKLCSQNFQTKIGKQLYSQYIDAYIQEILNHDEIFYLANLKQESDTFRIFQIRFLYKQQTIPKIKQAYQTIFIKIFNFQTGSPLILTSRKMCNYVFETINDMFSPINEKDKKLVHHLLRQFERLTILHPLYVITDFMPFYLSKLYFYQSQFLTFQLQKITDFQIKQLGKQKASFFKSIILSNDVSIIKMTELYIYQSFLLIKKRQQNKKVRTKYEKNKIALENKHIIQQYFKNVKILFDYILSSKGNQYFKKLFIKGSQLSKNIDYNEKNMSIETFTQITKIKNQLNNRKRYIFKKLAELYDTKFGDQNKISDVEDWSTQTYLPFRKSLRLVKLFYLVEIYLRYVNLFPDNRTNLFKSFINKEQIMRAIKRYICFPYLLKNLVEFFSICAKQQINLDARRLSRKEMDLLKFVDHARFEFSSHFRALSTQDPKNLDNFNKYPNIYSMVSQFQSEEYTISNIKQDGYSLNRENINANLINDVYGQILLIEKSQLRLKIQKQLLALKQKFQEKFTIQKNYMQYPYFADFLIMKESEIYIIMVVQRQRDIYVNELYQRSSNYFKNQKFNVLAIDKAQKIKSYFTK